MRKSLVVFGLAVLVAMLGCGNKTDQDELNNANTLTDGVLGMMTNVDAYSGYSGAYPKAGFTAPPLFPLGVFHVPWSTTDTLYYYIKWAFTDSLGPDTTAILLMLTPDVWDTLIDDTCFVTKVDLGLWRLVNQEIWWHGNLLMEPTDTTHISGALRWNFYDTWLDYAFTDMGTDTLVDQSGVIDVTTSDDIKLSAHFAFIADGSGTGWGKYQTFEFVHFIFFDKEDANGYKGYYTLASEGWKVDHYFPEQPGA
ncbi:MAG TPA: hypothetical protein VF399_05220 [bacterium]